MNKNTLPYVNLIPKDHIHHRYQSIWIGRWICAIVLTALIIGIPGLYIGGSAALTDSGMSGQIEDANQQYEANHQAIPLLQTRLELLAAEREVLDLVENRIEWGDVFSLLIGSAGNDVRFRRLNATGGGVEGNEPIELIIDALAPSQTIARSYVVGLENTGVFDSVVLVNTRREQVEEFELIAFQVLITIESGTHQAEGAGDAG